MRDIIENKEIKVNERNIIPLAEVKEESDVTLNLELYKNNMPFDVTGQSIKLGLLINNELIGEQSDGITINKNVVTIKLKNSFIQPGKLELDLTLTDNTGRMTTSSFYLIVNKKTIGGTSMQGTDLLETLDKVILYFKVNSQKAIDGFIAESTELLSNIKKNGEKTINDIKSNYDSLKQIIIDENQAANLQEQINVNKNKIEQLEDLTPVWQEYEGIGHVTVNNSFDGFTKDLVVKGRTLFNIYNPKKCNGGTLDGESFRTFTLTSNPGWHTVGLQTMNSEFLSLYKTNTMYTIITEVAVNTLTGNGELFRINENAPTRILNNTIKLPNNFTGILISKVRTKTDFSGITHGIYPCLTNSCTGGTIKIRFMIIEGDLSENEIPSTYFDSITSGGELEDNKIKIKSVGKNLFNGLLESGTINTNGVLVSSSTETRTKDFIKCSGTITISRNIGDGSLAVRCYDSNYNFVGTPSGGSLTELSKTYTLDPRTAFIKFKVMTSNTNIKYQIEEGTKATNYEQYRSKLIEIQLPFEGGLKSLPNGISDEIKGKEVIQRIGKNVLNGNEAGWILSSGGWENKTKVTTFEGVKLTDSKSTSLVDTDSLISNMNVNTFDNQFENKEGIEGITIHKYAGLVISINKAKLETQDITGFKKWLQANPITVYYELENPIIHSLHEYYSLKTYQGVTHLYQENNICGEVSFETAKDRDAIINGNTESISKLSEISELHIEESKNKNNKLQQSIESNSVSIRGIETKIKNFVTLEELGAVGDGVTDDLPALNKAMELMLQNKIKKVVGNGVYAISDTFYIDNKNDVTFEIDTIKPTTTLPRGKFLISVGSKSAGSMANINVKMNLLDGDGKANGIDIKGCGSSIFDVKTCVRLITTIRLDNPTKISSDNKFTGNNIRQCDYGVVIRSEEISACEGTIIDYNFIYDCKYAGILLGKGSHYTDIRSALDFNGKYSMIIELNDARGLKRGDVLILEGEKVSIVEVFGNCVYVITTNLLDKGNTKFKKGKQVSGKTIQEVITTNSDQNVFLDIINANDKAGFSRNIITSQYCGGIYGDKNSINTDFIVSYRTGKNENINLQGLEVATNSESVRLIEGRTGNNLFNYKSQEKVIELNNVQISGSRQNNVLPASAFDHPVASIQDLLDGLYSVNVIAQGRVDYVYQGLLVKYGSSKSITKIASVNVDLRVDETDTIKATNGSGSLSPTIAIYFTRLASY